MAEHALSALVGLIIGMFIALCASDDLTKNRISAGYFEHGGKAYRVEAVGQ